VIALEGKPLTAADLEALAARWIDKDTAKAQMLRRVASLDGKALIAANGRGDYSGLLIPYVWPGTEHIREYRLRRDHPEVKDGKPNLISFQFESGVYIAPKIIDNGYLAIGKKKLPFARRAAGN